MNPGTNKCAVEQYTIYGQYVQTFESALSAANFLGSNTSAHILEVCDGKRRVAFGYVWCYPGETPNILNADEIKDFEEHSKLIRSSIDDQSKAVMRYDMDGNYLNTFCSISEASRQTGVATNAIILVCQQSSLSAGGYRWMYKREPYKFRNRDNYRSAKVVCLETQKAFCSVTEASQALHIDRHHISLNCKGKRESAGGKHFKFLDEETKTCKAVNVYSKDDVFLMRFDTMKEAASWCEIAESTISNAMKHQGKLIKGKYRFRLAPSVASFSFLEETNVQEQMAV